MATESPRLRTSRSRVTTTSCCSRMPSTERTVSTASNDSARRAGPPTKTWSDSMAPSMESNAVSAAATSRSTSARPARRGRPTAPVSVRPTRCEASRRRRRPAPRRRSRRRGRWSASPRRRRRAPRRAARAAARGRPAGPSGWWRCRARARRRRRRRRSARRAGRWPARAPSPSRRAPGRRTAPPGGAGSGPSTPGAGQVVDEEAVALVGRDAAGARVGLDEVAVALERHHLGADGGRGDLHPGCAGHVRRARPARRSRCTR